MLRRIITFLLLSCVATAVYCHHEHHHDHHEHEHEHEHEHSEHQEQNEHYGQHERDHHLHTEKAGHHGHERHRNPVDVTYYVNNAFASRLDAPFHCSSKGFKANEIPLKNLITFGSLLDVQEKTKSNPQFLLQPEHLEEWAKSYDTHRNSTVLLINFGFASKLGESSSSEYPGISQKAAEWISNSKFIVGVGVDTPSVDASKSTEQKALHTLHGANIYTVDKIALNKAAHLHDQFYIVIVPVQPDKTTESMVRVIVV